MPSPPKFADLGKAAKDLFKKQYDYKNEVKVHSKAGGIKLETGGFQSKGLAGVTKANWTDDNLGKIEIEVQSSGAAKGSVKQTIEGVNLSLEGNDKLCVSLEGAYAQDMVNCTAKACHDWQKSSSGLALSAVLGQDGVSVGASVDLNLADPSNPKDYNVGAEYTQKDFTASLVSSNKGDDITLSFFQKLSSSTVIGTSMLVQPESNNRLFTCGTDYKLDGSTSLKLKADSKGIVGTALTHTLADPKVKMCISAQFDANSSDIFSAQKFGVSLALGDF